jgi:hypothetical protein
MWAEGGGGAKVSGGQRCTCGEVGRRDAAQLCRSTDCCGLWAEERRGRTAEEGSTR